MSRNPRNTQSRKTEREKYIENGEYKRLLDAAKPHKRNYLMLVVAGNLGLRVSELTALRVEDFRFDGGLVLVRTLKQRKSGVTRTLTVSAPVLKLIEAWVGNRKKGWLFPGESDGHISTITAQRAFKMSAKVAGLNPMYSIHSLRHLVGMNLSRHMKIQEVAKILGHKKLDTILWYTHITPGRQKEIDKILEKETTI